MWKSIRVNVKSGEIKQDGIKEEYNLLGGRALIAQFILDEVTPKCDPLGNENKLIFCTGVFAGTNIGSAHRLNVGGKSPLTGTIKESNSGGTAATYLANHGIKMVVIDDLPDDNAEWKILHIDKESNVRLVSAGDYVGLKNYNVVDKAKEQYGKDVSAITIGPAGEMLYKNAGIGITEFGEGYPCRLAARGGLGALMGSKKIKAIIMEKAANRYKPEIARPDDFKEKVLNLNKAFAEGAKINPMAQIGTASIVAASGPSGVLPVKNFNGEIFRNYEGLAPDQFMKNIAERGGKNRVACQPGCPVACSNHYNSKDGKHLTSSFEYETIGLCGSNLDIDDLDIVAQIDRFCDDFGVDTMEVGATLGVMMDAGKLEWGDIDGVFKYLKEMEKGSEFGRLMGEGTDAVGKEVGAKRIPTVKGQAIAAYDPRNCKSLGITYAMSTQGGDHTFASSFGASPSLIDDANKFFQPYVAQLMSVLTGFVDSSLCLIALGAIGVEGAALLPAIVSDMYGVDFTMKDMAAYSARLILTEKAFNSAAGFTDKDDRLPEFFYTEVSKATGAVFDVSELEMKATQNFI